MKDLLNPIWEAPLTLVATYAIVYSIWGIAMNSFGKYAKIAEFRFWWQIITVYLLYMIPISLILEPFEWYDQYAYGLFFMGILEFGGYALKSSIAHPNNLLDKLFGERNFALAMTLFFASYFPLGIALVNTIHDQVF